MYEWSIKKSIQKMICVKDRQGKPHICIIDVSKEENISINQIEESFPETIRFKLISKNIGSQKI